MRKVKLKIKDPVIEKVVRKFVERSKVGYKKYGVTLRDDKSNMDEWLNHLQEELMDAVNYIERAREELKELPPYAPLFPAEDYRRKAFKSIDVVDPVTYTYTGPEKLQSLKGECGLNCGFCNCTLRGCNG